MDSIKNRMRQISVITVVLVLSGCATFVEIGAGANSGAYWEDQNGIGAYLAIRGEKRVNDRLTGFCTAVHYSHYNVGFPFDERRESTLDHVGCGVRVEIGSE